jgi:hypothetical protein
MEEAVIKHIKEQPVATQAILIDFLKSAVSGGQAFTDFLDMTPSMRRKFDKECKRMYAAGYTYLRMNLNFKDILEKLEVDSKSQST